MVGAVVLGTVLCYLTVAGCYAGTRVRYARLRAFGPRRPAIGAEELTPLELGMLAGGNQRMGEVALAELYLSGRAVARGHGMVARPQEVERLRTPPLCSPTPCTRLLDTRLPPERAVSADRLVRVAAKGDPATAVLWRLRRLGLFFPPQRMHGIRIVRRSAWYLQALIGAAGVLFGGYAVMCAMALPDERNDIVSLAFAAVLLCYPFLLYLADRLIGGVPGAVAAAVVVTAAAAPVTSGRPEPLPALGLFAGWFALHAVYRLTGGGLGPRTRAGDTVLAEARAHLERASPADTALCATALLGFRELRRRSSGHRPPRCREFSLVRSFAAACGHGLGSPDIGLGGNCTGHGGSSDWGGDGDISAAEPHRPHQD